MARTTSQPKAENFNFRVPSDLNSAFQTAAELADGSAAQVIRDFMRAYVERELNPEPRHDEWVRSRVQAAVDDPRPAASHDAVMSRTRPPSTAWLQRIAARRMRLQWHPLAEADLTDIVSFIAADDMTMIAGQTVVLTQYTLMGREGCAGSTGNFG